MKGRDSEFAATDGYGLQQAFERRDDRQRVERLAPAATAARAFLAGPPTRQPRWGRAATAARAFLAGSPTRQPRWGAHCGFTLTEALVALAVLASIVAMGVPMMLTSLGTMRFNASVRDVQSELQTARLRAVSSNRPMRVRFNCPAAGQFRMVELIGTPGAPDALDAAGNRCSETEFPLVPAGANVLARPNQDGAVRLLRRDVSFTATQTIEFWPDGTAHADAGAGSPWPQIGADVVIGMAFKTMAKTITVNGVGKVQIQ